MLQNAEAQLLLAFKATFSYFDEWHDLEGHWEPNHWEYCYWRGVFCTNGNVTRISLENSRLGGSIPQPFGWELPPHLEVLSLANLTGPIPPNFTLPDELSELYLMDGQLDGTIPPTWRLNPTLRRLHLDSNRLQVRGVFEC
jgi:hypothetical protein